MPNRTASHNLVGSFDPDAVDEQHQDEMSLGNATGARNIPEGHSAQIDVTGGMGAGGLTTVVESVPGRNGLTFSADHVRDHWRLPQDCLLYTSPSPRD